MNDVDKEYTELLLPCPCCGSNAEYIYSYDDYNNDTIACSNDDCGLNLTKYPYGGMGIVNAWNRRI